MYKRVKYASFFIGLVLFCVFVFGLFEVYKQYQDTIWLDKFCEIDKEITQMLPTAPYTEYSPHATKAIMHVGATYIDVGARLPEADYAYKVVPKLINILVKHGLTNTRYKIYPIGKGVILHVSGTNAAVGRISSDNNISPDSILDVIMGRKKNARNPVVKDEKKFAAKSLDPFWIPFSSGITFNCGYFPSSPPAMSKIHISLLDNPYKILLAFFIISLLISLVGALGSLGSFYKTEEEYRNSSTLIGVLNMIPIILIAVIGFYSHALNPFDYTNLMTDMWFGPLFIGGWGLLLVLGFPFLAMLASGTFINFCSELLTAETTFKKTPHTPEMIKLKAWTIILSRPAGFLVWGLCIAVCYCFLGRYAGILAGPITFMSVSIHKLFDTYYKSRARTILTKSSLVDQDWLRTKQQELNDTAIRLAGEMNREPLKVEIRYDGNELSIPMVSQNSPKSIMVSIRAAQDFTNDEMEFMLCRELAGSTGKRIPPSIIPVIIVLLIPPLMQWIIYAHHGEWLKMLFVIYAAILGLMYLIYRRKIPYIEQSRIALRHTKNPQAAASVLMKIIDYNRKQLSLPDQKIEEITHIKDLGLGEWVQYSL